MPNRSLIGVDTLITVKLPPSTAYALLSEVTGPIIYDAVKVWGDNGAASVRIQSCFACTYC